MEKPKDVARMRFSNSEVSVIVPVYNEGRRITENLELLVSEIEKSFSRYQIIVISDGSTDETNDKVQTYCRNNPNVNIEFHASTENMGKGKSIRLGFDKAVGDYIFFIDGGMELHPKELRIFFGLLALYEADIVVGSKRHPQSQVFYPAYRRFLSRLYQGLLAYLFDLRVTDTQVGMKLFRRDVVIAIKPHLQIDRYGFDLEALALASAYGYKKILEAPITLDYFIKDRPVALDLFHVFKVGLSLIVDTLKLYKRVRKISGKPKGKK